jgi:hypothetical protein
LPGRSASRPRSEHCVHDWRHRLILGYIKRQIQVNTDPELAQIQDLPLCS